VKNIDAVMKWPLVYRLWMAPQVEQKFAPVLEHNDVSRARRVLDVGCGPGTNADKFRGADYLGIDWNERYIRAAQKDHAGRFVVGDVEKLEVPSNERFDFIFVGSLLHHIDDTAAQRLLSHLAGLLTEDGHIHIIELVLPPNTSVPRILARLDRGEFPRPLSVWRQIFNDGFEESVFEPLDVTAFGFPLWKMVYFKGRARQ
jgi:SAM-dependent methyltransferase